MTLTKFIEYIMNAKLSPWQRYMIADYEKAKNREEKQNDNDNRA